MSGDRFIGKRIYLVNKNRICEKGIINMHRDTYWLFEPARYIPAAACRHCGALPYPVIEFGVEVDRYQHTDKCPVKNFQNTLLEIIKRPVTKTEE